MIANVEYFFQLQFGEMVYSLALVSIFSPLDLNILELSHHVAYICHHGGIGALTVIDVKTITAVISMVPDYQVTFEGDIVIPENMFSLIETPFLKLASLCGTLNKGNDAIDISIVNIK
jgi:hypothetical protein